MTALAKVVGGKIPPKEHRKLNIEDSLDTIFERLVFARLHSETNVRKDCRFMPEQMGPMWIDVRSERDDIQINHPSQVNSADLVWPVGVGVVSHDRQNEEWGNSIQCNYWQSVPAKALRGSNRFVGVKNVGWYHGILQADRTWTPLVRYAAWHMGGWRTIEPIRYNQSFLDKVPSSGSAPLMPYVAVGEDDIGQRVALGQSLALTYRYEWGAQFSIDDSVKIIVPTTPRGVLELFNDRDKPVDRDRRASLRHWVSQHRRRKPTTGYAAIRSHLRGENSFNWRGFDVTIVPSQFDQEQNSK